MSTLSTTNIKHPSSGSNNIVLDSSGRVLVGTSSSTSLAGWGNPQVQVTAANSSQASLGLIHTESNNNVHALLFGKIRGTGIVQGQDELGRISWQGYDGSAFRQCAEIMAVVDGTPGASDMPGRLVFSTTADGASSPTERLRITSTGDLRFNSGYGSVATAYGCRAWINFQGNGGYATRGSGNVSSFTEVGSGNGGVYNVNLTNALPDTNGIILCSKTQSQPHENIEGVATGSYVSASQLRVVTGDWDGTYVRAPHYSASFVHVAVIR